MKKKPKYIKEEETVKCPVCEKNILIAQTSIPLVKDWYHKNWGSVDMEDLVRHRNFKDWCCLDCLKNGKAILPNYDKQYYGMGGPLMLYTDKNFNCYTCKQDFVFSAKEQQHWFEDLRFLNYVYPKNCLSCRRKIRAVKLAHKQLAELLKEEKKSPEQLLTISKLYEELGIEQKAANYAAQAKNKRNDTA
jgi:hypothetical protein